MRRHTEEPDHGITDELLHDAAAPPVRYRYTVSARLLVRRDEAQKEGVTVVEARRRAVSRGHGLAAGPAQVAG